MLCFTLPFSKKEKKTHTLSWRSHWPTTINDRRRKNVYTQYENYIKTFIF